MWIIAAGTCSRAIFCGVHRSAAAAATSYPSCTQRALVARLTRPLRQLSRLNDVEPRTDITASAAGCPALLQAFFDIKMRTLDVVSACAASCGWNGGSATLSISNDCAQFLEILEIVWAIGERSSELASIKAPDAVVLKVRIE